MNAIAQKVLQYFALDLRSLALLRISMAIVIIADLVLRFLDLQAHYTDFGLAPRSLVLSNLPLGHWSIFFAADHLLVISGLFALNGLFAIALLCGFQTRWAAIACWILLISLQVRNPYINDRGDMTLRLILFWSMFLPLGARFSIDRKFNNSSDLPNQIANSATLTYTIQICLIYWFAAMWKSNLDWITKNGVYYALSVEFFVTAFGQWLLNFPLFLSIANISVLILEWFGTLLLFVPHKFGGWKWRCLAIVLFILLHVGFGLTLELGLFPWISAIAWLSFIPSEVWDKFQIESEVIPPLMTDSKLLNILGKVIREAIMATLLVVVFIWNIAGFRGVDGLPYPLRFGVGAVGIWQKWDVFAPLPLAENGWFVIPGKLANNTEVNLFKLDEPVSWEKPPVSSATYAGQRWRKYYSLLWLEWLVNRGSKSDLANHYVSYICRNWNTQNAELERLVNLEVNFVEEDTLPNYKSAPLQQHTIKKHQC
jgi:hypothetical protein